MMTKRNFIALADYIREAGRCSTTDSFSDGHLATLADFCRNNNPRFNRERWLGYIRGECGPNGGAIRKPKATKCSGNFHVGKEDPRIGRDGRSYCAVCAGGTS